MNAKRDTFMALWKLGGAVVHLEVATGYGAFMLFVAAGVLFIEGDTTRSRWW